jgi:hypothetical protein
MITDANTLTPAPIAIIGPTGSGAALAISAQMVRKVHTATKLISDRRTTCQSMARR